MQTVLEEKKVWAIT